MDITASPLAVALDHDLALLAQVLDEGGSIRSDRLGFDRTQSVARLLHDGVLYLPIQRCNRIGVAPHTRVYDGYFHVVPHARAYLEGHTARRDPNAANPYSADFDAAAAPHAAWVCGYHGLVHTPPRKTA